MNKSDMINTLESAIGEIDYSIKSKSCKSEKVREHYIGNAVRYIQDVITELKNEER